MLPSALDNDINPHSCYCGRSCCTAEGRTRLSLWQFWEQGLCELICGGIRMRVQEGDQSGPQQESITQLRNAVSDTLKVLPLTSIEGCSND